MKKLLMLALMFTFPLQAGALSLDLSALSSSTTRQIAVNGIHIHQNPKSLMEVSGKYARTQGRDPIWDIGVSQEFYYPFHLRAESEYRYFHDRNTYAGGVGIGHQWLSLTAGARVENVDNADRQTYGRLTALWRGKRGNFGISAKLEGLRASSTDKRWDYKVEAKQQIKWFYIALRFEDVRRTELQAISIGVKF